MDVGHHVPDVAVIMSINDIFGGYQSQSTRALASIDSTKYPDTNKDFQANMQRLNQFVDYMAEYMGQMQKGVDKANQSFMGKFHDMISNIGILLGGGDTGASDIDWGDLQYYLPAIGALLGFDANTPFPINLINAAEHFFLGFVVPLNAWEVAVSDQIDGWATSWGLDEDFTASLHELLDAWIGISDSWDGFLQSIVGLFDIIGIDPNNTDWLEPLADLWNSISNLFGGFDLKNLGTILNPIFHSLAPWISDLADGIDSLNQIIKSWSGGLSDLRGILNFANMFSNIDFTAQNWTITGAWDAVIAQWFSSSQQFAHTVGTVPVPIGNLVNIFQDFQLDSGFDHSSSVAGGGNWSYDDSVGRLAPGSFKVVANGTFQAAHGNWIPVSAGETVNPEAYILWTGLSLTAGAGNVVAELQLTTDDPDHRYIPIATINTGVGSSGTWTKLTGSYLVPSSGVTKVKTRIVINVAAALGIFWWDDAPSHKGQNLLPQSWIEDLQSDLNDLWDDIELAGQGKWDELLADLGLSGIPGLADWLNSTSAKAIAAQTEFNLFLTTGDWSHLMNSLFGSSSSSPQPQIAEGAVPDNMSLGKILGLPTLSDILNQLGTLFSGGSVSSPSGWIQDAIDWFSDLFGFREDTTQNAQYQQSFQIGLSTGGYRNPMWVCRYPIGDVTYPESLNNMMSVYNSTGSTPTGDVVFPTYFGILPGMSRGGIITTVNPTVYDTVGMYLLRQTNSTINNIFLEVLRIDASGNARVINSENVSSYIPGSAAIYLERTLNPPIIAQPGERYVVRLRNSSTTSEVVHANAIWQQSNASSGSWINTNDTSDSRPNSSQTTYTAAEVAAAMNNNVANNSNRMVWAALATVNPQSTDQLFSDDFNRLEMGSLWYRKSDNSGQIGIFLGFEASYSGLDSGAQHALYIRPTASPRMSSSATLAGTGLALTGSRTGPLICCNRDMTQVVFLGVNGSNAGIFTGSLGATLTQRGSLLNTSNNDVNWEIRYDPATNKYTAYKAGKATSLTWTDSGNVINHSPDYFYGGFRIERSGLSQGAALDNWVLRDWVA